MSGSLESSVPIPEAAAVAAVEQAMKKLDNQLLADLTDDALKVVIGRAFEGTAFRGQQFPLRHGVTHDLGFKKGTFVTRAIAHEIATMKLSNSEFKVHIWIEKTLDANAQPPYVACYSKFLPADKSA